MLIQSVTSAFLYAPQAENSLLDLEAWLAWVDVAITWAKANLVKPSILLLACALVLLIGRRLLLSAARRIAARTSFEWDDLVLESRVLHRISYLLPILVIHFGITWAVDGDEASSVFTTIRDVAQGLMILVIALTLTAALDGILLHYRRADQAKRRAIKGYVQVLKLIILGAGGLMTFATMIGSEVGTLFAGLGAMTAVLLLVFKDTILSLVASVQISSHDIVRIGDWIEMPGCGADGDVIDIALHTVKIRNFDKTIVTVPTAKLYSESFKNWRGMKESGGRRIKRSLFIDMSTVRFLEDGDLEGLSKLALIKDYLQSKREALAEHNASLGSDAVVPANSRRLTNLGTFRAYIFAYLKQRPDIHQGMTMLVRQLQPSEKGQPIELYVFTKTTNWNAYEAIQADIFDHLYAVLGEFDLRIFQAPSGGDFSRLADRS